MPLCLVLHDLSPTGKEALAGAVWDLAESHLALPGGLLVATGVSAGYLLSHLRRAVERAGERGAIVVTRVEGDLPSWGMDDGTQDWIEGNLDATADG